MANTVSNYFAKAAQAIQPQQRQLRELIFATASHHPDIGEITETLKWGEPAYFPIKPNIGSTLRLAYYPNDPEHHAIHVNCRTQLIATFEELFPSELNTIGTRSILLNVNEPLNDEVLSHCIALTLRYHLWKNHRNQHLL